MSNKKVVLLKEATQQNDPYVTSLSQLMSVKCIPVLCYNYINKEQIQHSLQNVSMYNGIIFTSPRGVLAVKKAFKTPLPCWANVICYTVGEATKREAEKLGFNCKGEKSGTGAVLAHLIVNDKVNFDNDKNLLFISGTIKRPELSNIIIEAKLGLKDIIAYETFCDPSIELKIKHYLDSQGVPDFLVFFSPSGVKFCLDMWREIWNLNSKFSFVVSIGTSTTEKLESEGIKNIVTASSPNPKSLLDVIEKQLQI